MVALHLLGQGLVDALPELQLVHVALIGGLLERLDRLGEWPARATSSPATGLASANSSAAAICSSTAASAASAASESSVGAGADQRVAARALLDLGLVAIGGLVAGVVAEPAVGLGLDQGRALAGAGARRPPRRRRRHGRRRRCRRPARRASRSRRRARRSRRRRGPTRRQLDVAVVLADEDDRQLPEAAVLSASPKRPRWPRRPRRRSRPRRRRAPSICRPSAAPVADRDAAADDAVGAEQADAPGSRCASSRRGRASSRRRGRAARPSSGRRARPWRGSGGGRGGWRRSRRSSRSGQQPPTATRLLADREVQRPGDVALVELLVDGLLEAAAEPHQAVARQAVLRRCRSRCIQSSFLRLSGRALPAGR